MGIDACDDALEDIEKLPVWNMDGGLCLQWWPRDTVLNQLPQCSVCSLWYTEAASGSMARCYACARGWTETVAQATASVLERLTKVTWVLRG